MRVAQSSERLAGDNAKRDFHFALAATFVPVLSLPVTWWLVGRSLSAARLPGSKPPRGTAEIWGTRTVILGTFDTLLAALLGIAWLRHRHAVSVATGISLPQLGTAALPVPCSDLWRPALWSQFAPVLAGVLLVLLLSAVARRVRPTAPADWGVVALPLLVAPLIGAATVAASCAVMGGFRIELMVAGLVAQSTALLAFGALALRRASKGVGLVVGPRLTTSWATTVALFYLGASLARAVLVHLAALVLLPALRGAPEPGLVNLLSSVTDPVSLGLFVVAAVVLAPIGEEIVFRGVLLPGLAQFTRPMVALFLSAVVFAVFHVPSHGLAAVFPGVLAMAFGWARLRTGGLAAPIMLHAANNLLVTLALWLRL